MADAATIRRVLGENGIDVPERGNLSAKHRAEYDRLIGGDAGDSAGEPLDQADTDDVTAVDDLPEPAAAEVVPRRPTRQRAKGKPFMDRLRGPQTKPGTGKGKATRAVKKRIRVDRLASRFWEVGGRIVSQVDVPLGRVLVWQSDSAGLMVEQMVAGTFVDKMLQPLARAEERAETGFALLAPGACVAALRMAEGLPDEQKAIRQAIILPILREALAINIQISGTLAEERIQRGIDLAPLYAQADQVLSMIFATPEPAPQQAAPEMASA